MWRRLLVVLSLLAMAAPLTPTASATEPAEEPAAYGAFRLVKAIPADTGEPEIILPAGYTPVAGDTFQVPSRAEFYSFVHGPRNAGVRVTVRWPGVPIAAVVFGKSRLPLTPEPDGAVSFTVPVTAANTNALQSTLQVWSFLSPSPAGGLHWRVEHNDPDRVAGVWHTVPWPGTQARTYLNLLLACEAILRDSGLIERARRRGHFFSLMGFETNNTLHADNPPHWHLAYYPGGDYDAPRAHVPHFWMDRAGITYYNGMDVKGEGRSRFYAGDPAPIEDAQGNLVVTLTIRADGGLDIQAPGGPRYEITSPQGRFPEKVHVYRDGEPWRWFGGTDDVDAGLMTTRAGSLGSPAHKETTVYWYDELTGQLESVTTSAE
ncbi:hypothetical protein [Actinophytocola sediminis]